MSSHLALARVQVLFHWCIKIVWCIKIALVQKFTKVKKNALVQILYQYIILEPK